MMIRRVLLCVATSVLAACNATLLPQPGTPGASGPSGAPGGPTGGTSFAVPPPVAPTRDVPKPQGLRRQPPRRGVERHPHHSDGDLRAGNQPLSERSAERVHEASVPMRSLDPAHGRRPSLAGGAP
jgi:hypothetical protein